MPSLWNLSLFLFLPALSWGAAPQPELRLEMPGVAHAVTLKELKKKIPVATLTVDDPVYKTRKTYEGFWLQDVLKAGGLGGATSDEIVFHCADGYSPTLDPTKLNEGGTQALLAFREKGRRGDWEKFKQGKQTLTPAPFYLVWNVPGDAYPWPYQLVGIEVVQFKAKYSRIFPEGQARDTAVYRGFEHFRSQCLRCHSLNLQGGDLGPELNYPKNILEYWDEATARKFIRNPGDFRARDKMPAFPQFSDRDLDDILGYLKWMKDHKNPG